MKDIFHRFNLDTGDADEQLVGMIQAAKVAHPAYEIISVTRVVFGQQPGYVVVTREVE